MFNPLALALLEAQHIGAVNGDKLHNTFLQYSSSQMFASTLPRWLFTRYSTSFSLKTHQGVVTFRLGLLRKRGTEG